MSFQSVMDELRGEYLAGFPKKIELIHQALNSNDCEFIELEFHKLKGTGSTYGLPEVSLLGETVERACKTNPTNLKQFVPLAIKILETIHTARLAGQIVDLKLHSPFLELQNSI